MLHLICLLLNIVRVKYFIVLPDGEKKRVYIKSKPDIIYFKDLNEYYCVISETCELINKSLTYNWLKVEKL
jgi:hypothetical protein